MVRYVARNEAKVLENENELEDNEWLENKRTVAIFRLRNLRAVRGETPTSMLRIEKIDPKTPLVSEAATESSVSSREPDLQVAQTHEIVELRMSPQEGTSTQVILDETLAEEPEVPELEATVYGTPGKKSDEALAQDKPFKCDECPFTTSKAGALGSHKRVHNQKAPRAAEDPKTSN
jgi:hypothetical protein